MKKKFTDGFGGFDVVDYDENDPDMIHSVMEDSDASYEVEDNSADEVSAVTDEDKVDLDDFDPETSDEKSDLAGLPPVKTFQNMDYREIMRRYHSDDKMIAQQAKEDMMIYLDRYIRHLIKTTFSTYDKYYADLYQEGAYGLLKGLEKYDAEQSKPTTFLGRYILHEMAEFINTNVNRTSSHYSTNIVKINRAIEKFTRANKPYTLIDLATETGLTMETVAQAERIKENANEVHYESANMLDFAFSENFASPEDEFVKAETLRTIHESIMSLDKDEAKVILLKFGIAGRPPMAYKDVAKAVGLPVEKVRKLYNNGIRNLRNHVGMKHEFHDYIDKDSLLNESPIELVPKDVAVHLLEDVDSLDIDF